MQAAADAYFAGSRYVQMTDAEARKGYSYGPSEATLRDVAMAAYTSKSTVKGLQLVPALSTDEAKVYIKPGTSTVVVAFRGTVPTRADDLAHDYLVYTDGLHGSPRWKRSINVIEQVRSALGPRARIYTTGHSLGGSLARDTSNHRDVYASVGFNTGYGASTKAIVKKPEETFKFYDKLNKRDVVSLGAYWRPKTNHSWYSKGFGLNAHRPSW